MLLLPRITTFTYHYFYAAPAGCHDFLRAARNSLKASVVLRNRVREEWTRCTGSGGGSGGERWQGKTAPRQIEDGVLHTLLPVPILGATHRSFLRAILGVGGLALRGQT